MYALHLQPRQILPLWREGKPLEKRRPWHRGLSRDLDPWSRQTDVAPHDSHSACARFDGVVSVVCWASSISSTQAADVGEWGKCARNAVQLQAMAPKKNRERGLTSRSLDAAPKPRLRAWGLCTRQKQPGSRQPARHLHLSAHHQGLGRGPNGHGACELVASLTCSICHHFQRIWLLVTILLGVSAQP